MLRIDLDIDGLARTRLACSPLHETLASLRLLANPTASALQSPWLRDALPRLRGLELELLRSLVPQRGYAPDFLTPPPESPLPTFDEELARVVKVGAEQVRSEIQLTFSGSRPPAVVRDAFADPAMGLRQLVSELKTYHTATLHHWWPTIRSLLEKDISQRARQLAEGGTEALFAGLHPALHWRAGEQLTVNVVYNAPVTLNGQGLLLMPSVFTWPSVSAITNAPWQPTLVYPARGLAAAWEPKAPLTPNGLEKLLGRTRFGLLSMCKDANNVTGLADRLGVSASAISQQVTVLRAAGLLATYRDGRCVYCRRTLKGDQLMSTRAAGRLPDSD